MHITTNNIEIEKIYNILETVCDPEVPVLTIMDLGIVRQVSIDEEKVAVTITPTYTGCPAMDMISMHIRLVLVEAGFKSIEIKNQLTPVWTTDWMTEAGKQKLLDYGIAPPNKTYPIVADGITCPQCKSHNTKLISEFGSTACKSLLQCNDCKEPFDYFKCY